MRGELDYTALWRRAARYAARKVSFLYPKLPETRERRLQAFRRLRAREYRALSRPS